MVEELGLEPGSPLQELEQAILRQDASLNAEPPPAGTRPPLKGDAPPPDRGAGPRTRHLRTTAALLVVGCVAIAAAIVTAMSGGGSATTADPNSVAVVDVQTNRLVGQVLVGTDPTAVSAAGRSVWVASAGDDTVSRVDERTRRVGATIAPGTAVDGMAAGEGAVAGRPTTHGV